MLTPAIERLEHVAALHHHRERRLDAGLVAAVLVLLPLPDAITAGLTRRLRDHRRPLPVPRPKRPKAGAAAAAARPAVLVTTNSRREILSDMSLTPQRLRFADGLGDCRLRWLSRAISIDTIRDAARNSLRRRRPHAARADRRHSRPAAPRSILKLETLQPIGSFKIRGAYNAVRRLRPRATSRDGVWTVSAGNAAQGVALAARKAGVALQRHGHGHGARGQAAHHQPARRDDRQGHLRRVLAHGRDPRARRSHDRALRPSVRRRRLHQRQRHRGTRDRRGPARTSTRCRRRSAAAGCSRASASRSARCGPRRRIYAAEPETAAPLQRSFDAGRGQPLRRVAAVVRRRRRRQVRARHDVAAAARVRARVDRRLARRRGARDAAGRRARARHRRRRRRPAPSPPPCLPAMAARGHKKVVAVVSGGNVDLAKFAQLVGACP